MEIRSDNKINFGWTCKTHKKITQYALQEFPLLKQYRKTFKEFVQKPDYDELGFFGNWHFYSTQNKKSFMDFNGKNNAFARYELHIAGIYAAIKDHNRDLLFEHAGRALHFLQDMTQPQHVQKGVFFNKVMDCSVHVKFEKFVKKRQEKFFKKYMQKIKMPVAIRDFETLFLSNVKFSSESKLPIEKNKYEWNKIGKKGFNKAVDSTREFMAKLTELIQTPSS